MHFRHSNSCCGGDGLWCDSGGRRWGRGARLVLLLLLLLVLLLMLLLLLLLLLVLLRRRGLLVCEGLG